MAQVIECLPSKCKVPGSNPSPPPPPSGKKKVVSVIKMDLMLVAGNVCSGLNTAMSILQTFAKFQCWNFDSLSGALQQVLAFSSFLISNHYLSITLSVHI
jgi:hypothetical protein